MSALFGPLNSDGCVPSHQQTRAAAFLISAHGALARQFALALPLRLASAWQTELNAQFYRETEIVSLLMRATSWVPDFALSYLAPIWEAAWLPRSIACIADQSLGLAADLATRAHAIHAGIRPAALLPPESNANDPFVTAIRRIEFESGRLLQAQISLLKDPVLSPFRDAVSTALEGRHTEINALWSEALAGVGVSFQE